jgi:hypothetical protein
MNGRISRTPRTLTGLVAALGLLVTLAMPTMAAPHEGNPGGNCDTTATSVKTETNDGSIVLSAGTIFCVKASDTNTGTLVADGETTLNEYLVQEGINNNVSNFVVYATATSTATPTPTPTPTPSESEAAATPTPTPSETQEAAATPREDTMGGNPAPAAGVLPNTATDLPQAPVPAAIFALMAVSSLTVLMYVRLTGAPARR